MTATPAGKTKAQPHQQATSQAINLNRSSTVECKTSVAGLVLLGPFISALLERAGLTANKKFISTEAQLQAASLLTWATCGYAAKHKTPGPLESWLVLLPTDAPHSPITEPSAEVRNLIEDMLTHVCARWPPLSHTSNQGLREAFLIRDGKLALTPEPQLIVHTALDDVLLDRLPWSINLLSLPWRNSPLSIDWR